MNYITLDFTGIRSLWNLHEYFKEVFTLPDYYGHNMDALWDCLRYLWSDGEHVEVKIYGFLSLPSDLKEHCRTMLEVFDDVHRDTPNVVFELVS